MQGKILIVDDDANLRETITDLLDMSGLSSDEAESGAAALELIKGGGYDVALVDYNLPDITGIELIKKIRGVSDEVQILMMTGHASLNTAIDAIKESVYSFLVKPVDFKDLLNAIKKAGEKLALERENKRLIQLLKERNAQLDRLNMIQSRLTEVTSHDLSNVLMTLEISYDMLKSSLLNPDAEQREKIAFISRGIAQLKRLTGDLSDLAAIKQGKFRIVKNCFELPALIRDVLMSERQAALNKNIAVTLKVAPGLKMIMADKRRTEQVLFNLVENALRHTPRGGHIDVTAKSAGDFVLISVKDSGEGIEPEMADKIFQDFYQAAPGGGLGLGLSIAKEIVKSHGGDILAKSGGKGKGAEFKFTLPFAENAVKDSVAGAGRDA